MLKMLSVFTLAISLSACNEALNKFNTAKVVSNDASSSFLTQLGAVTTAAGGNNAGDDRCLGVALDGSGNVYCAGRTSGSVGEANGGDLDAFVIKLNAKGETQWLTQLGATTTATGGNNSGTDRCSGVSVDSAGNVYCAGVTTGGLGEANVGGSEDIFIMKLNSSGDVVWVTHLGDVTTAPGGSNAGIDQCNGVAVDNSGNVYCAGRTTGSLAEANGGSSDAFVIKLNSSGAILWATQLGAVTSAPGGSNTGLDQCLSVAVDSGGNVYCAGVTSGALAEASGGGNDTFLMKLDSSGALQWVTQFGAVTVAPGGSNAGNEQCNGVSVDGSGNVYCAGVTTGAFGEASGGSNDAFVLKLNSTGALQWLTHFGAATTAPGGSTTGDDRCLGVSVDGSGNVFCAGRTSGAFGEANGGGSDLLVLKLDSNGDLVRTTQLGADTAAPGGSNAGADICSGVAQDSSGKVVCAGLTDGDLGEANGGGNDIFLLKLDSSGAIQ